MKKKLTHNNSLRNPYSPIFIVLFLLFSILINAFVINNQKKTVRLNASSSSPTPTPSEDSLCRKNASPILLELTSLLAKGWYEQEPANYSEWNWCLAARQLLTYLDANRSFNPGFAMIGIKDWALPLSVTSQELKDWCMYRGAWCNKITDPRTQFFGMTEWSAFKKSEITDLNFALMYAISLTENPGDDFVKLPFGFSQAHIGRDLSWFAGDMLGYNSCFKNDLMSEAFREIAYNLTVYQGKDSTGGKFSPIDSEGNLRRDLFRSWNYHKNEWYGRANGIYRNIKIFAERHPEYSYINNNIVDSVSDNCARNYGRVHGQISVASNNNTKNLLMSAFTIKKITDNSVIYYNFNPPNQRISSSPFNFLITNLSNGTYSSLFMYTRSLDNSRNIEIPFNSYSNIVLNNEFYNREINLTLDLRWKKIYGTVTLNKSLSDEGTASIELVDTSSGNSKYYYSDLITDRANILKGSTSTAFFYEILVPSNGFFQSNLNFRRNNSSDETLIVQSSSPISFNQGDEMIANITYNLCDGCLCENSSSSSLNENSGPNKKFSSGTTCSVCHQIPTSYPLPSLTPLPQFGYCSSCSSGCTPPSECRLINDFSLCTKYNKSTPCCLHDISCSPGFQYSCGAATNNVYCQKCTRFQNNSPWCSNFDLTCGWGKPAQPRLKFPPQNQFLSKNSQINLSWYAFGEGLKSGCAELLAGDWSNTKWHDCDNVVHFGTQPKCVLEEDGKKETLTDRSCWGYACARGSLGIDQSWRFYKVYIKHPASNGFSEACNIANIPNTKTSYGWGGTLPTSKSSCSFTFNNIGSYQWFVRAGYSINTSSGISINYNDSEVRTFMIQ